MSGITYGYARVSTQVQNEGRQLIALRDFGVLEENIIVEKQSGKDFERPLYQGLIAMLQPRDVLVVQSIDRLGRNYTEILDQWRMITKERKAAIVVLDMPLLDTREGRDLTSSCSAMWPRQSGRISASGRRRGSRRPKSAASSLGASAWSSRRISPRLRGCGRAAAFRPDARPGSWGSPTRPFCAGQKNFQLPNEAVTKCLLRRGCYQKPVTGRQQNRSGIQQCPFLPNQEKRTLLYLISRKNVFWKHYPLIFCYK